MMRPSGPNRGGRGFRGNHDHEFAPVGHAGRDAIAAVGGRCADPKNMIPGNPIERRRHPPVAFDRFGELKIRILGLTSRLRRKDSFVVPVNKLDRIQVKPESVSWKWSKPADF
jgi:hypothetical protein